MYWKVVGSSTASAEEKWKQISSSFEYFLFPFLASTAPPKDLAYMWKQNKIKQKLKTIPIRMRFLEMDGGKRRTTKWVT